MLNDPETHFSVAPEGIMKYAEFMHDIGTLKGQPKSWKDLFFPLSPRRRGKLRPAVDDGRNFRIWRPMRAGAARGPNGVAVTLPHWY